MSFKYINPGYAGLLNKKGPLTTIENYAYNPTNRVCISGDNNTYDNWAYIRLPYVPEEIFGMFNIVITEQSHHSGAKAALLFHSTYGIGYSCVGFCLQNEGSYDTGLRCCFNVNSLCF